MKPYYDDGRGIVIYHGDCHEIISSLPKFDLLLTDPPYGIKRFENGFGSGERMVNKACSGFNNNKPEREFLKLLIDSSNLSVIWGMNNLELPTTEHFLVWDKEQTVDNFACAELAWCNLTTPAKVFRYAIHRHNHSKNGGHPTEKPVTLMSWCISLAGDVKTIFDPFMGSGTTLRAAKDLGRKAMGIEREEKYCEIAAKRLRQEILI